MTVWDAAAGLIYVSHGDSKNSPLPYDSRMILLKAIALSGGFTIFGNPGPIKLIRNGVTTVFKYKDIATDPSRDIKLQPDDQIIVPD